MMDAPLPAPNPSLDGWTSQRAAVLGSEPVARVTESLAPHPALALAGLFDIEPPVRGEGDVIPPGWHWVYLLDRPATAELGTDGHRAVGGIPEPPGPLMRRMYAGGRLRSHAPLVCGRAATRISQVTRRVTKEGRSGPLTFVTVRHTIAQDGVVVLEDEQDLVYRDATRTAGSESSRGSVPSGDAHANTKAEPTVEAAVPRPTASRDREPTEVTIDPIRLFRFSALTYNAHRIHYDEAYARQAEHYDGLVVHGPLQVLLMIEALARSRDTRPKSVSYRLIAPLLAHQRLLVGATADEAWVTDGAKRTTAEAFVEDDG